MCESELFFHEKAVGEWKNRTRKERTPSQDVIASKVPRNIALGQSHRGVMKTVKHI